MLSYGTLERQFSQALYALRLLRTLRSHLCGDCVDEFERNFAHDLLERVRTTSEHLVPFLLHVSHLICHSFGPAAARAR